MALPFTQPAKQGGKTLAQLQAERLAAENLQQSVATTQLNERPLNNITTNPNYAQDLARQQANAPAVRAMATQMETPVVTTPTRTNTIAQTGATPANPIVPVSSTGNKPPVVTPPPVTNIYTGNTPTGSGSNMLPTETIQQPSMTSLESYAQMNPEQQLQAQSQAFQQGGQMQVQNLNNVYGLQDQMLADKQALVQTTQDTQKAEMMAQREKDVADYEAEVNAQKAASLATVQKQGQQATENVQQQMAFQGFGRSTKAGELVGQIADQTVAQVASIERETNRAIKDYQAQTLDKVNAETEKLQARVEQYGDARSALELQKVQKQGELLTTLYEQNPLSPQNMIKAAQAMVTQRTADAKATKEAASANFKYMNENFGSEWLDGMSEQDLNNYASAMGMPTSVLTHLGKTLDQQKNEWEKAKYFDSQDFEVKKMMYTDELARNRAQEAFGYDNALQDRKDAFEWNKLNFADQKEQQKALNKWGGIIGQDAIQYSGRATAANGNGLYFDSAQPHPSANTAVSYLNPVLAQAYPDGYKFKAADGAGGMGGQCKWFAQQLTTLENGQSWKAGSTLADTKANFNNYAKQGLAFKVGQEQAKVGQTVLSSDSSTYGHSYTINAITPDGKWVVTEANFKGPLTVSNNRVVDPNSDKIIGVLKTKPKPQYQIPSKAINVLGQAMQSTPFGGSLAGAANMAGKALGMNMEAAKAVGEEKQALANTPEAQMTSLISSNPFLSSVAKGATNLTASDESEMLQTVTPEFKQAYLQAKNQSTKQLSPSNVMQVRKEVAALPTVKNGDEAIKVYRNLNNAYESYKSGKVGKNIVDQSLILMFNKMLDPGSVVKEGEYERTRLGQPALEAIQGNLSKLMEGGAGISDKTREDMIALSYELAQKQSEVMKRDLDAYKTYYVDELGMKPFEVLGTYSQYYQ